jgi:hypothetical protein
MVRACVPSLGHQLVTWSSRSTEADPQLDKARAADSTFGSWLYLSHIGEFNSSTTTTTTTTTTNNNDNDNNNVNYNNNDSDNDNDNDNDNNNQQRQTTP